MTHKNTVARIQAELEERKQYVAVLSEMFAELLPYFEAPAVPDNRQWNIWLRRYPVDIIAEAIERTAEKYEHVSQMAATAARNGRAIPDWQEWTLDTAVRYASGVMVKKMKEGDDTDEESSNRAH